MDVISRDTFSPAENTTINVVLVVVKQEKSKSDNRVTMIPRKEKSRCA